MKKSAKKEKKKHVLSARIRPEVDKIITEECEALGINRTEYIERLVEGAIPSRLERMFLEIGEKNKDEIIKAIKAKK